MNDNLNDIPVMPTLTLDPLENEKIEKTEKTEQEINTATKNGVNGVKEVNKPKETVEEIRLTEAERKLVNDFAQKIDITNANIILQYGSAAQKKVATFSESALENVKTKDLGEVGEMLTNLVTDLKSFVPEEEQKGIFGFFKKTSNKTSALRVKYDKAEANIDNVCSSLEKHQINLLKDIVMLDKMYDLNLTYSKELAMYIVAGKQKLDYIRNNVMVKLVDKATQSNMTEDAQAVNDMAALCDRFEKKIHDLELTRMISMQMAPQIRLVQNSNNLMAEKIQSTIVNTIPLWKNQMVLALGVAHLNQAMEAQRSVSDMTNQLLLKNAEILKMGTVETAKESERGIVDIETLKKTNESLISTIDEVVKIQQEGRSKRHEAEIELSKIEGQLREKLLQFKND